MPSFEDASLMVDVDVGRLFGRAAAVLTSNALNAGAATVSYAVHHTDDDIELTVTDDAGGFDLADAPAGRGLWALERDLGAGSLSVEPAGGGSSVTVRIGRAGAPRAGAAVGR